MNQDVFFEKIVVRKLRAADYVMVAAATLLAVVATFFIVSFLPGVVFFLVPLLIIGICYGWLRVYQSFQIEHEFIFTNGELDVDRIVARKRRKHILTVDVRSFEVFAPMRKACADEFESRREGSVIVDLASMPRAEGRWFAAFRNGDRRTLMIFEPGERMVDAIAKYIPHKTKRVD